MGEIQLEVDDVATAELNDEIITLKKKIQLSEGQRKAQYEEYDSEKKKNTEEIRRIKKAIKAAAVVRQSEIDEELIRYSGLPVKELKEYLNKPPGEVKRILDLKNIDLQKRLDLTKYEIFRKQDRILEITKIMEDILMETDQDNVKRFAAPIRKEVSRLENRIHLVHVNILELRHMQKKYFKIKDSLQEDGVYFESTLKKSEEDMAKQKAEIARLQVVKDEAIRMRDKTRNSLAVLETQVITESMEREAELHGLRKKVEDGKSYLEKVERSLAPTVKPLTHQDSNELNMLIESEEAAAKEAIETALSKLKHVTGAKDEDDIIKKFKTQRETRERLVKLKETVEREKKELEKKKEKLEAELEAQKFAQVKEKEQNEEELERLKLKIEEAKKNRVALQEENERDKKQLENITGYFHRLNKLLEKYGGESNQKQRISVADLMNISKLKVGELVKEAKEKETLENLVKNIQTDEPLGLEDETRPEKKSEADKEGDKGEVLDVPTRSFLKRQSQLIVEAKTRRKGFNRDPLPAFK
ncbi:Coiled-coil domain containing 151 [Nesidiocoris tenuis]|uniref:Coiled-coil domain containing 151 n=1 Tax=Nesidiocoris tenuis TaxID=355587 RepID=A0ABN7ARN1_9HEMI|nr:Coiled-coil domain containing 151 [Nesidiocoris tenuis]